MDDITLIFFLRAVLVERCCRALGTRSDGQPYHPPRVYCAPIEDVPALTPATHAYSFWEGIPTDARCEFGRLFRESPTLMYICVVQKHVRDIEAEMEEYGFGRMTLLDQHKVSMTGSGRNFQAYVLTRAQETRPKRDPLANKVPIKTEGGEARVNRTSRPKLTDDKEEEEEDVFRDTVYSLPRITAAMVEGARKKELIGLGDRQSGVGIRVDNVDATVDGPGSRAGSRRRARVAAAAAAAAAAAEEREEEPASTFMMGSQDTGVSGLEYTLSTWQEAPSLQYEPKAEGRKTGGVTSSPLGPKTRGGNPLSPVKNMSSPGKRNSSGSSKNTGGLATRARRSFARALADKVVEPREGGVGDANLVKIGLRKRV